MVILSGHLVITMENTVMYFYEILYHNFPFFVMTLWPLCTLYSSCSCNFTAQITLSNALNI